MPMEFVSPASTIMAEQEICGLVPSTSAEPCAIVPVGLKLSLKRFVPCVDKVNVALAATENFGLAKTTAPVLPLNIIWTPSATVFQFVHRIVVATPARSRRCL